MSWFCLHLRPSRKKNRGGDADSDKGGASGSQNSTPRLAHGDRTRTLFSATSSIRPGQLQQSPTRLASLATDGAPLGAVAAAGSPAPRGNLPSAFMRTATELHAPRGESGRFTPAILSPSVAVSQQRLPKTVKVIFSRVTDVPANREGDVIEDRTFLCSVYFDDETMTKAVDNPSRVTQPAEGFYSGIKHYEVPLNNQSIVLDVPSGPEFTGTDPLTGEKKTPPLGFRVALTEQLVTGNQIYKGSTQLLRFDDVRLTQMTKWPLTNPVFRQGAGCLFLRCELTYGGDDDATTKQPQLRKAETAHYPFRSLPTSPAALNKSTGLAATPSYPLTEHAPTHPQRPPFGEPPARFASGPVAPYAGLQADRDATFASLATPPAPLPVTANLPPLRPTPRPVVVAEKPEERLNRKPTMKEVERRADQCANGISLAYVEAKGAEEREARKEDRPNLRELDSSVSTVHSGRGPKEEENLRRSQTSASSTRRQDTERDRKKEKKEKKKDDREERCEDGEEKKKKKERREKSGEDAVRKEKKAKKSKKERSERSDSDEKKEGKNRSGSDDSDKKKKGKKKKKENRDNESPRRHRDKDCFNESDVEEKGEKKKKKRDKDKTEKLGKEKSRSKKFHDGEETDTER
ncbi:hypothetical protein TGRUB_212090 [Toxoplasma gondii RUB]|uniref:Uncharacterized protein n=4 Tax=Toxoplasma gondii TaxID=5811 RepID=S7UVZ8_TOXGG|nr:hypothetical protein TGGT1_212090 [Toxoplasma gondii GT1]KAF4640358.1 hypothetical protein TGRH88_042840 [Toxoplasma gondii]KFG57326.1 hypothetical protein TGRUB_212090 [Toxoplasma gondii RUB]KFH13712.1 hypothetical protein TGVAND_212090 [Toxoplasma gondii VAND]